MTRYKIHKDIDFTIEIDKPEFIWLEKFPVCLFFWGVKNLSLYEPKNKGNHKKYWLRIGIEFNWLWWSYKIHYSKSTPKK